MPDQDVTLHISSVELEADQAALDALGQRAAEAETHQVNYPPPPGVNYPPPAGNSGYMGSFAGYEAAPETAAFDYGQRPTFSAAAGAGEAFDYAAYQARRNTGQYVNAPNYPPPPPQPGVEMPRSASLPPEAQYGPWVNDTGRRPDPSFSPEVETPFTRFYDRARDAVQPEMVRLSESLSGGFSDMRDAVGARLAVSGELMRSPDMGFALGFGFMSTAGGLQKALSPVVSGEAYLPGQVTEQAGTSLFPLIGAIGGTVLGSKMGSGLAGQFVGQAAGQTVEDLVDQYATGHTFTQQRAGESLGASRGGKEAIDEFVEALRSAATPAAKELAETLSAVGKTGPVAAGAASEFGQFQFALGSDFTAATGSVQKFLDSSPFFTKQRAAFGTAPMTGLSANDYQGLAAAGAATGNYEAMENALAYAEASETRGVENPAYRKAKDFVDREDGKPWYEQVGESFQVGRRRAYWKAKDRLDTMPEFLPGTVTPATRKMHDDLEAQYETFQQDQATIAGSVSRLGADSARMNLAVLQGGGAAALEGAQAGLETDSRAGINAVESDITLNAGYRKLYPQFAPFYSNIIAQDRQKEAQLRAVPIENAVNAFQGRLREHEASFGYFESEHLLHGATAAEMAPGYGAEASYLRNLARSDNSLNPEQRDALETRATQMGYASLQSQYAENLGTLDNTIGTAGVRASRAGQFGSAGDLDNAQGQQLDAFKAKIAELNQELAHGVLTAGDRIAKERELSSTYAQSDQIAASRRDTQLATADAFAGDQLTVDTAGLSRQVQIGGSGVVDRGALDRDFAGVLSADQARINAYAPGSVDRRNAEATFATDTARFARVNDGLSDFHQGAQDVIDDMQAGGKLRRAESAFHRSLETFTPYGGPNTDRITRGLGLERSLDTEAAREKAQFGQEETERTRNIAAGRWSPVNQEHFIADQQHYLDSVDALQNRKAALEHDRQVAMFSALPEMIEGSPGRGIGAALIAPGAVSAWFAPGPGVGSWAGGPAAVMARLGGAGAAAVQGGTHPYHSDMVATGTGHGSQYEGLLPGYGRGNIGTPGTPGYSGILQPHHMAPGSHTGSGYSYEGMIVPQPMAPGAHTGHGSSYEGMMPPARSYPSGQASGGTGDVVAVLRQILRALERPGAAPNSQNPVMPPPWSSIAGALAGAYNPYTHR